MEAKTIGTNSSHTISVWIVLSHLLLSLFKLMVDDEAATVVESIVDCVASSARPLSVLAFDTSIGNCRLDPVLALFASPQHWATCTNNSACDIVSKLSHRSHFNVSKPMNSYQLLVLLLLFFKMDTVVANTQRFERKDGSIGRERKLTEFPVQRCCIITQQIVWRGCRCSCRMITAVCIVTVVASVVIVAITIVEKNANIPFRTKSKLKCIN